MIGIGLYGINGHQIQKAMVNHPLARVVAVTDIQHEYLPSEIQADERVRVYHRLEDMLADDRVELVSLCSARRIDQATHALSALNARKHVLAEKPCAMSETSLNALVETARRSGRIFHEMAGTSFEQPYAAMREIVSCGRLGQVVQVIVEKSYPWHAGRPQDEKIDGGLIAQCAIHALRMVEQVAGTPVSGIQALQTSLGNPVDGGGLYMAASLMLTLGGGGLASICANYLNMPGTGVWGNESLKILGTKGSIETRDGGRYRRLVIGGEDLGDFDVLTQQPSWLDRVLREILHGESMPLSLEEELSPTRWALRAREKAMANT